MCDCEQIHSDITELKARLKAIGLGKAVDESQYAGHRVKFTPANPSEVRRQIRELEDELIACRCPNAPKSAGAIRPVL